MGRSGRQPSGGEKSPFGQPKVHQAETLVVRVPGEVAADFSAKTLPSDAGYVHPTERMNPDYHAKAKADAKEKAQKLSMGYGAFPTLVNPSPNSIPKVSHFVF